MERGRKICYFIRCNDLIKIGYSSHWRARLGQYKSRYADVEIIGIIAGDRSTERSLHRTFAQHCVGGEWFRDGTDLRVAVAAVLAAPPAVPPPKEARARVEAAPDPRAADVGDPLHDRLVSAAEDFKSWLAQNAASIRVLPSDVREKFAASTHVALLSMIAAGPTIRPTTEDFVKFIQPDPEQAENCVVDVIRRFDEAKLIASQALPVSPPARDWLFCASSPAKSSAALSR